MKNTIRSIHHFFFSPFDSLPLALFRILIGLFGLCQTLFLSSSWLRIYGVNGYVEWFIGHELFSIKELPSIVNVANLLLPLGFQDNTAVYIVTTIYVLALIGMTLGWRTRMMAIVAWLSHFTICNTAMAFGYGVETFMHIGLFYLMFSPCAEYLSLDAKMGRTGQNKMSTQARFMIRVMQIHLCLVYFNAGFAKLQGEDWLNGQAIWYVLGNTNYSQYNLQFLADIPLVTKCISWWTLGIETCFPLFMFWKRTRLFWWINILLLHIGIGVFMGLYMFGLVMILHNIAAFMWLVCPSVWKRFADWVKYRENNAIKNIVSDNLMQIN
jgi:hypothetical protein